MQTYDLLMLAVLGAATIFGFWKGLAWQIASLASLVVSYFVALKFADRIAPMLSQHAPWNKFLAMLVIYAGASFAIWMIYRAVGAAIDRVKLNEFDRQMGALVGFAKGVLLCIAITFFGVTLLSQTQRERIIASRSGQYIVQILDKADAVAPPEIRQVIGPYIQKVRDPMDPSFQPAPSQIPQAIEELWREHAGQNGASGGVGGTAIPWPTTDGSGGVCWPSLPPLSGSQQGSPQTPATPISTAGDRR